MDNNLRLYYINMKYVRDLKKVDDNVMSVSPQIGKENKPFIGTIVICDDKKYCVPLTSPKPKHEKMRNGRDFSRIFDNQGKLIGALNFNNMIPVTEDVIQKIDVKIYPNDSPKMKGYKTLLTK